METQVEFTSHGQVVFGVLHVPEVVPAAGVVMCHGFTGSKSETHRLFVNAARDFCAHGLAVLRFDFRGSGDSAGEFREMTVAGEIDDAAAAFNFLAGRPEVDAGRLGALGLSLGGCVTACLAGREPRLRALVLWAAVAHLERSFRRLAPEFGDQPLLDMNGWGLGRDFLESARTIHPLEAAKQYTGPSLVIHGTNDSSVPPSDASDYRVALGGRCELHYVQGADHTFSSLDWKGDVIARSREFLRGALSG